MRCRCGFEGVELWFLTFAGSVSQLCRCCQFDRKEEGRHKRQLRYQRSYVRRERKVKGPLPTCSRCIEIERFFLGY